MIMPSHECHRTFLMISQHWFKQCVPQHIETKSHHFPGDIFTFIFSNENVWISNNISLKFVPKGQINKIPVLVDNGFRAIQATSHYLNQWWLVYWCITWSQWVDLINSLCPLNGPVTVSQKCNYHRPTVRDLWFGFDGICALSIVMGIFVLLRVRARNHSLVEMFLCINFVLSSDQVMISHMNR